jgi:hypothetical protein
MKKILTCLTVVGFLTALIITQRAPAASTAAPTSSTEPQPPDIVVNGFKEFKTGGYVAATNAWAKESSLLQDAQTLQALNNYFSQISANSGAFVGADVVRIVNLSANTQIVYTVAKFERQLVYISFTCYKTGNKSLVTWIVANKDPSLVLPTMILSGN